VTGTKTNERPGTRAQVRYARMSPYKAREVLDLIRGLPVDRADEVLQFTERAPAVVIRKVLASAIANAAHNDQIGDESVLYVSACYADEGPTLKRWRPRARGRATRIRKRTSHITLIVSVMSPEMQAKVEADRERTSGGRAIPAARRGRTAKETRRARVAKSRAAQGLPEDEHDHDHDHDHEHDDVTGAEAVDAVEVDETAGEAIDETAADTADEAPEAEADAEKTDNDEDEK
jgi:large subunit ribosomal protein L22